jgi:16S rRNA (uracil1498-N3)-methyltransferase
MWGNPSGRRCVVLPQKTAGASAVRARAPGDTVMAFKGPGAVPQAPARGEAPGQSGARAAAPGQAVDLWLVFASCADSEILAAKAAEMGCSRLIPVLTLNTDAAPPDAARLSACAAAAARRCHLATVPAVAAPMPLAALLAHWAGDRSLLFCDETTAAPPALHVLGATAARAWAVLIGPERGFAPEEAADLRARPFVHPASLGPRIMRPDTAAVTALAAVQMVHGDWR